MFRKSVPTIGTRPGYQATYVIRPTPPAAAVSYAASDDTVVPVTTTTTTTSDCCTSRRWIIGLVVAGVVVAAGFVLYKLLEGSGCFDNKKKQTGCSSGACGNRSAAPARARTIRLRDDPPKNCIGAAIAAMQKEIGEQQQQQDRMVRRLTTRTTTNNKAVHFEEEEEAEGEDASGTREDYIGDDSTPEDSDRGMALPFPDDGSEAAYIQGLSSAFTTSKLVGGKNLPTPTVDESIDDRIFGTATDDQKKIMKCMVPNAASFQQFAVEPLADDQSYQQSDWKRMRKFMGPRAPYEADMSVNDKALAVMTQTSRLERGIVRGCELRTALQQQRQFER